MSMAETVSYTHLDVYKRQSFSYYAFLPLDVNDYTDYLGERYWLTERYTRCV